MTEAGYKTVYQAVVEEILRAEPKGSADQAVAAAVARAMPAVRAARAAEAAKAIERAEAVLARRRAVIAALERLPAHLAPEDVREEAEAAVKAAEAALAAARRSEWNVPEAEWPAMWRKCHEAGADLNLAAAAVAAAVREAASGRVLAARSYLVTAAVLAVNCEGLLDNAFVAVADAAKPIPPTARPWVWRIVEGLAWAIGVYSPGVTRRHAMTGVHWDAAARAAGLDGLG